MTSSTIDPAAADAATPEGGHAARLSGVAAWAAALSACGGGGDASTAVSDADRSEALAAGAPTASASAAATTAPTREQAARLLAQASFSSRADEILDVQRLGLGGWLEREFNRPRGAGYVQMISPGQPDYDARPLTDGKFALERALWRKFITAPDVLRQRVTLALSEIIVISPPAVITPQRGFASAAFMDILEGQAFGNYGDLLLAVSTTAAMGAYLTFLNSHKANDTTGSQPDENYAREVMQLFSIGLYQLKPNGKPVLVNGERVETYTQDDVMGLARVFTGWTYSSARSTPWDPVTNPMRQIAAFHESHEKVFLGTTIPANTSGEASLKIAIDTLMAHPNVGPFIGRQLIQRLVTSNPSPEYVQRVAAAFDGDGRRRKGDLKATLRAIFLDDEATTADNLHDSHHGKLREPMVRFIQWARTFGLKPATFQYFNIGDLSDPAQKLGQSPLHSPTVFNFFRPGYVPPNSDLGLAKITAPEFQITTESSVAGYINFMEAAIAKGVGGATADYTTWLPLAQDSAALLAELNVVMAAGQVSPPTLKRLAAAVDTIEIGVAGGRLRRVQAALTLLMAAPEYLVLK